MNSNVTLQPRVFDLMNISLLVRPGHDPVCLYLHLIVILLLIALSMRSRIAVASVREISPIKILGTLQ